MSARLIHWLFGVVCFVYLAAWGGHFALPLSAIDINFHLEGPSENPPFDPDGSILLSIFEAAATYWEAIFVDSRSMTVDIEWEK